MSGEISLFAEYCRAMRGPARNEPSLGSRSLQPAFTHLTSHNNAKSRCADPLMRLRGPFEQAGLQPFGQRLGRPHTQNPVVTRPVQVLMGRCVSVPRHDARSISASNTPSSVHRIVVDHQNFCAGKQSLQRPPQPQAIILSVQQGCNRRHSGRIKQSRP